MKTLLMIVGIALIPSAVVMAWVVGVALLRKVRR